MAASPAHYSCLSKANHRSPVSRTDAGVQRFFAVEFPDIVPLIPTLIEDCHTNPTSSLVMVRCYPWVNNRTVLIGDAAHAIVPFYGQGMNYGFEDCRVLDDLMDQCAENWDRISPAFQQRRKPDADAIADL
jgi:kynurenine 3-monooxygenase